MWKPSERFSRLMEVYAAADELNPQILFEVELDNGEKMQQILDCVDGKYYWSLTSEEVDKLKKQKKSEFDVFVKAREAGEALATSRFRKEYEIEEPFQDPTITHTDFVLTGGNMDMFVITGDCGTLGKKAT